MDFNKVLLMGYIGKDPVVSSEGKKPFARVSLATNKRYKQDSHEVTETYWHNVIFYGPMAELVKQYVKKGSRLFIEGELENHKWKDAEGNDRYSTNIVAKEIRFLDNKNEGTELEPQLSAVNAD